MKYRIGIPITGFRIMCAEAETEAEAKEKCLRGDCDIYDDQKELNLNTNDWLIEEIV